MFFNLCIVCYLTHLLKFFKNCEYYIVRCFKSDWSLCSFYSCFPTHLLILNTFVFYTCIIFLFYLYKLSEAFSDLILLCLVSVGSLSWWFISLCVCMSFNFWLCTFLPCNFIFWNSLRLDLRLISFKVDFCLPPWSPRPLNEVLF